MHFVRLVKQTSVDLVSDLYLYTDLRPIHLVANHLLVPETYITVFTMVISLFQNEGRCLFAGVCRMRRSTSGEEGCVAI